MNSEDFIALAGKLAALPQAEEATYRTAVSRSYYGAFHVVKRFFEAIGLRVGHDHGEPQRCLIESGHPRSALAGRYLNDLHSSRVKADYDLVKRDVAAASHARECVEVATDICSLIEHLDAADRAVVKTGVENHRRRIAAGPS